MKIHDLLRHAASVALRLPLPPDVSSAGCTSKRAGDDVAATVDGRKIYRADVEKYYQNQTAGSDQVPVGEQATSLRLSILKELIDNEILMRRAEKLGLLATDEEVDAKLNEIKSPYTKEQFDARLKEKKITVDDFKRDLRRSLTVDKVLNKEITSKINVTDQDITNYYNAHKAEFNLIEPQYHLARILVTADAQSSSPQPEERQSAERSRCPQENPDDHEPPGQRRRLRHSCHELLRGCGDFGQRRRPGLRP